MKHYKQLTQQNFETPVDPIIFPLYQFPSRTFHKVAKKNIKFMIISVALMAFAGYFGGEGEWGRK